MSEPAEQVSVPTLTPELCERITHNEPTALGGWENPETGRVDYLKTELVNGYPVWVLLPPEPVPDPPDPGCFVLSLDSWHIIKEGWVDEDNRIHKGDGLYLLEAVTMPESSLARVVDAPR